jgi:hypothetical protein
MNLPGLLVNSKKRPENLHGSGISGGSMVSAGPLPRLRSAIVNGLVEGISGGNVSDDGSFETVGTETYNMVLDVNRRNKVDKVAADEGTS